MNTFSPDQTAAWTASDIARLEGHTITVTVENGTYEGRTVHRARPGMGPTFVVEWEGGGSLTWVRDNPGASITVHDEETL
ncbi:hypothetical protein AB0F72_08500 [Actinoplanes sp. NPDC023936]|uniref:hypothetical protein n=1 Tax=Actinoplanes sp. NPDC023936 TaxID=3154910 RepID=UPI0033C4253F